MSAQKVLGTITTYEPSLNSDGLIGTSDLILPADPAVFFEGFCPNCRVPLGGGALNWCPQCGAYWHGIP